MFVMTINKKHDVSDYIEMLFLLIYFIGAQSHFRLFDKETNYSSPEILEKHLMRKC